MSVERLVATPAVLILMFLLVGVGSDWRNDSLAVWAIGLAAAISGLLGGAAAIESLASEARARTWDWQRLSGLGPWSMTWGKLFGSTLHAQFGALISYVVFLWVGGLREGAPSPVLLVILGLATGLWIQSTGMLVAAWQIVNGRRQASPAASYILSAAASGLMMLLLVSSADRVPTDRGASIVFYGMKVPAEKFWLATALAFGAWSLFGTYRVLREALQGQSPPWAPVVFCVFLGLYAAGLFNKPVGLIPLVRFAAFRPGAALIAQCAFAYLLCVDATMRRADLERWLLAVRSRKLQVAWRHTPAWIACAAWCLVSGMVIALWASGVSQSHAPPAALGLVFPLIVVRDAGLFLALRLRGGALASEAWLLLFCFCVHGVLPWVVAGYGAEELRQFFSVDPSQGWQAVPVLMCEILLVIAWLRVLWRAPKHPE
jgi:hypothetical protein